MDAQLFPQRFFNSLTLHLTLKHEAIPNICQCKYWKNGVKWGNNKGVVTSMELVNDNRCVLILMSCDEESYDSMISLRRNIIKDILNICREYCPTLKVEEFVIDPVCLKQYPIEKPRETTAYCVKNMRGRKKDDYVYPTYPTFTIKRKRLSNLLPHEPDYDNLSVYGKVFKGEQYCSPRTPQTSNDNRQKELSIDNLDYIVDTLRSNHFPDRDWKELGHHLGLDDATLDDIDVDERCRTFLERFEKCMHTWLKREAKSWKTLVEALNKMGQKEVAKSITSKTLSAGYY